MRQHGSLLILLGLVVLILTACSGAGHAIANYFLPTSTMTVDRMQAAELRTSLWGDYTVLRYLVTLRCAAGVLSAADCALFKKAGTDYEAFHAVFGTQLADTSNAQLDVSKLVALFNIASQIAGSVIGTGGLGGLGALTLPHP